MQTASLKIKKYANSINIVNNNINLEKKTLNIMLWTFGLLSLCYLILLATVVFNIIERKNFEAESRNLMNDVGTLELQYMALSNTVDMTLATSMGFQETKAKYATLKTVGSIKLAKNEL
ncbi:hypothetical protein K8Q94_00610 [Candidatus Nomurabacteria bacterium]|nr:hypothetical protein [Candidatus Nomurabacteria bacterium]